MRTYESGAELAAEITKRANLFIGEFAEVPAGNWDLLVEGVDRTPRQMLAYQLGWMELLLGWERDEQAGIEVVTPAPGSLYESFYKRWGQVETAELIDHFKALLAEVINLVNTLSATELFAPDQRAWASSTPSAWPVWKWIHINTVAPFTTFRTKIRKWKKLIARYPATKH